MVQTDSSLSLSLSMTVPPQILLSSACSTTTSQVNCSCETVGNPSPTLQWYLNGLPVNQSGTLEILSETLNSTALRSFFTLNQPHMRDLSTVLCRSFNSLGSASQQFCVSSLQVSAKHEGSVLYPVIISTLAVLLLVLICVLLFIIR
uniref:Ig-like domain-containing protein n=1 Tax=Amphilophus citrinellus TaxID=61819 RepID=A0A3Q0R4H3_AMPCI